MVTPVDGKDKKAGREKTGKELFNHWKAIQTLT